MTATWTTAIARVDADDVIVRGYRLSELVQQVSFTDMVFLVHTGELPTPGQQRVLDAVFVSLIEHGISPSTMITRSLASCGTPIQASIAGGALSIADWHGGSGEALAEVLVEMLGRTDLADESIELADVAREYVTMRQEQGLRFEGFGHPQHPEGDPRAVALLEMAASHGVSGRAVRLLGSIEDAVENELGRRLPANITGALAALIVDLGFSWRAIRGLVIAPRAAGLAAHVVEELEQGNRWRHASGDEVEYSGLPVRTLLERNTHD